VNLNAAALRLMAEKGLTLHDVAEIVAANEQTSDPTNAQRQARHRAKKKGERNGVTVTRYEVPLNESILNPSSSLEISNEITPPIPETEIASVKPEHVVEAWNLMADQSGVPKAKLTLERRKKIKTFITRHTIDDITEGIWAVPRSPFLCGENDRGWKANIDFFLQPSSFTKLIEGSYGQ